MSTEEQVLQLEERIKTLKGTIDNLLSLVSAQTEIIENFMQVYDRELVLKVKPKKTVIHNSQQELPEDFNLK